MRLPQIFTNRTPAPAADETPLAVLEFQSPTAAVIATRVPRMAGYTNYFIFGLVAVLLVVASVMTTDRLVTANGILVSSAPDMSIQAFSASSIVQSIDVQPGQLVDKGQILATLNPTYAAADLDSQTKLAQGYRAAVDRLQAQENGTPYVPDPNNPASVLQMQTYTQQQAQFNFTMQDYAQKISALRTNITGYESQAAYYKQRLGIASNVETMRKDLQHLQVGSKLETLAATDDRVNVQAQLSSAESSAAAAARDLAAQEAERDSFEQQTKATISQQLSEAENNLAQAQQALAKAQLNDQLVVLRAPRNSIVQAVAPVSVGSVMAEGQTLVQLAPIDAPLTVAAEISASESGYVHVGDSVIIKFATLPYLEFGSAKGTVRSISPESINPLDSQSAATSGAPLPGTPQALYYKAQISLDLLNLHNTPPGFKLVPGMPLEADMKVGSRTIMGYFLQQMLPVAYNSLHEP